MLRRHLGSALTVVATVGLVAGAAFAVGLWRKSVDSTWCKKAVIGGTVSEDPAAKEPEFLAQQRSACAQQRRHQRIMFGSMWRKGGSATAECAFQLARAQMLDKYPEARKALVAQYGIDDPEFDGVGRDAQDRFIKACLAQGRHEAG